MKNIENNKYAIIKEFLPPYLLAWGVFGLSVYAFTLVSFYAGGSFGKYLLDVFLFFSGISLFLVSISMVINGLDFLLSSKLEIDKDGVTIELPKLVNFREKSEFKVAILNKDCLVIDSSRDLVDNNRTIDKIGMTFKIMDKNDNEIPTSIYGYSCKNSFNFNIRPNKRRDLAKARRVVVVTKSNIVCDISFLNLV